MPATKWRPYQARRLEFLEKHVQDLTQASCLRDILLAHLTPQVVVLEADPRPAPVPPGAEHGDPWRPPRPALFLNERVCKLVSECPGMLFHTGVPDWQVGLTLDRARLVFVPHALYSAY